MKTQCNWKAVLLAAGLLTATVAPTLAQECSNAHFRGRYAFFTQPEPVMGDPVNEDQWAIAGVLFANGNGLITEWKDIAVRQNQDGSGTLVEERDLVAAVTAAGNVVVYDVTSDCRIMMRADLGPVAIEVKGALASGGREVFATQTSPNGYLGVAVFRSFTPPDSETLSTIKDLLARIAIRMGLRP